MRTVLIGAVLAATAVVAWGAHAKDPEAPVPPLVRASAVGALELGRVVERLGDGHVLERLDEETDTEERWAAVGATPWLRAPEQALDGLALLASGRDPDLAPAAAEAALSIASALDPAELTRREVALAQLASAQKRLAALAADATARSDVRHAAGFASDALAQLSVGHEAPLP
jgi:hypothetical protein